MPITELAVNIIDVRQFPNRVYKIRCADCGTVNHACAWEVERLPGTYDGETAVVCWKCDTRQAHVMYSAILNPEG